jgi:hypothetical protein
MEVTGSSETLSFYQTTRRYLLRKDTAGFSETLVPIYQIPQRHIPESRNVNIHRREDPQIRTDWYQMYQNYQMYA